MIMQISQKIENNYFPFFEIVCSKNKYCSGPGSGSIFFKADPGSGAALKLNGSLALIYKNVSHTGKVRKLLGLMC